MKNSILSVLFLLAGLSDILAQKQIVKLWPDGVPGSVKDTSYRERTENGNDGITRVFRVKDPELIVYPAPENKSNGTAIVICPGGGYQILAIDHEGYYIAEWLNELGITAFVLKYRLPDDRIMKEKKTGPLTDAVRAMQIVREGAQKWNIDPGKIGIMGFSAGGHLASTLSTHYDFSFTGKKNKTEARPDFSILVYPVISMDSSLTHMGSRTFLLGKNPSAKDINNFSNDRQIGKDTSPTYLVHAADDKVVPVQNSINYFLSLKKFNIPVEMHIYQKGGHGFGIKNLKGSVAYWMKDLEHWLRMNQWIK